MELTYQLDSVENLQPAKEWKQGKKRIPSELHCVGVAYSYNTIKISMLGHYLAYTSSLNINIFFKKDLLAQHRLLSDDSYSYVYICIFIPSHTVYILFTTQSQKLVIICDMLFYQHCWWVLSLLLSFLSPVLCDAYCIKYLHRLGSPSDRDFPIKWVWSNLSDKHHQAAPNNW